MEFNYLKNLGEKIDTFSWTTFIAPFHWQLWFGILVLSCVNSAMLWVFHRYPNGSKKIDPLEALTVSIAPIFGIMLQDANDSKINASARFCLFVTYLCGSIYFYVYGGYLTSALAIPSESNPFGSPEELLETNYR